MAFAASACFMRSAFNADENPESSALEGRPSSTRVSTEVPPRSPFSSKRNSRANTAAESLAALATALSGKPSSLRTSTDPPRSP